ncbi:MAG TPA: pyridoxamine 5'-phosphate oxidase family protein [Candidatus Dormibacteraeota bacterium]|nr:pyridoxamine 5'-phosphate oxidase family protein [Candidatus Dormibacteraeota bacterium]
MPRSLGPRLPADVQVLLNGQDLPGREGDTFLLITAPEDGWPHVAMLSVGEVFAANESELRLALWPGSQTTKNLTAGALGLLMVIASGAAYYVRLRCRRLADAAVRERPRALFSATVDEVLQDTVDYAEITGGIGFRLRDRDRVLAAWAESVDVMRSSST